MIFPQMKIKDSDVSRAKQLKNDLFTVKRSILNFAPRNYNLHRLNGLRVRIFPFTKEENCNEYFIINRRKKYVCLNARLLSRRYYAALQYVLHGIAHSFCYLRGGISEEVFCEFVSYSILKEFLEKKGGNFARRIIKSVMKVSSKDYNTYFRAGRKLDGRKKDILLKLNSKAKSKKLSRKKEKQMFSKLLKFKKIDDSPDDAPELEKGFRRI